jgi:hypothetical protein
MVRLQGDFAKAPEKRFNYKHCFDALYRVRCAFILLHIISFHFCSFVSSSSSFRFPCYFLRRALDRFILILFPFRFLLPCFLLLCVCWLPGFMLGPEIFTFAPALSCGFFFLFSCGEGWLVGWLSNNQMARGVPIDKWREARAGVGWSCWIYIAAGR